MVAKYNVRVFNGIDDIGKESIDTISNDPFFTYGWFKTLEISQPNTSVPLYVAVYDETSLIAFLPCFVELAHHHSIYGPYLPFIERILSLGKGRDIYQNRILICYSPFCFRSRILIGETDEKDQILNLLLMKIDDICKEKRILVSSFTSISISDNFLSRLETSGYLKTFRKNLPYLPANWSTFEEYLASLKHKRSNTARYEIKKCRDNGLKITEERDFEALSGDLATLYSNLYKKHEGKESPFNSLFFSNLGKYAKDKVTVFVAKKEDVLVGFSLLLRQKDTAEVFITGFNYDYQKDFAYFNLVFYEPIKWAIRERITKLNYGFGAEKAKLLRGCKQEQMVSFVKFHNKLLNSLYNLYGRYRYRKFNGS